VSFFLRFLWSYLFLRVFVFFIYLRWLHFMGYYCKHRTCFQEFYINPPFFLAYWTALILKATTNQTRHRHHKGPLHELPDLLRFFLPFFPCVIYYFTFFFLLNIFQCPQEGKMSKSHGSLV